jgi:hypothetical protein
MQSANTGAPVQGLFAVEAAAENSVGGGAETDRKGKNRFKIRDLFADERCTRSILDFLRTTEVGRRIGPKDDEPGAGSGEDKGSDSGRRAGGVAREEYVFPFFFSFVASL